MKPRHTLFAFRSRHFAPVLACGSLAVTSLAASGATIGKADNTDDLNLATSWSGGSVPGALDVANWSGLGGANSTALGANLGLGGITIGTTGGAVTITGANTLTLGSGGIDMSAASQNLTVSSNLALAQGAQTWRVATGRTLTLNTGTFTRATGAALNLQGAGTVTSSMSGLANVNSIVGPWATVGSGTSTRYAALSAGTLTGLTSATSVTAFGWTSGNNNTFNYDVAGVQTQLGVGRQANTARYTGAAGTQNWGNNNTTTVTLNGLMNAGTGTLTFSELGGTGQGQLAIGTNNGNELVLASAAADITIKIPIVNTGSNAGSLLVTGPGTVSIDSAGGISTYTGQTTVAGGTLLVNGAGNINSTSGITVNGTGAKYVHTSTVASTRAITLTRGTLDGTGAVGSVTAGAATGGIVTNGNGGSGVLTLASLAFNGAGSLVANKANAASVGLTVTGALTTNPSSGQVTIGGSSPSWNLGLNNLLTFGSFSGSASDFAKGTFTGLGARQIADSLAVNGSSIALNVTGDLPVWTGLGGGVWTTATAGDNGGTNSWLTKTARTLTNFWATDHAEFGDAYDSGSGPVPVAVRTIDIQGADVRPASVTFNHSSGDYTLSSSTGHGVATGTLAKDGSGMLTISSTNTYNGGTTLTGGTLAVNHASALGSGAVTIQGGTLDNTSGGAIVVSSNNAQNWNGDFAFTGSGNLDLGSGAVTVGGSGTRAVTIAAGTLAAGELKTGVSQGFTKQGGGTLVLSSDGAGAASSVVGGALDLAAGTLQINRASGNSGDLTAAGLTGSGTLSNGAAVERWFFTNAASGTFEFSGSLVNGAAGGLGFNKSGASTQILSGASSYTGATTVTGGDLVIRGANSGAGTNVTLTGTGLGLVLGHENALGAASLINLTGATSNATLRYATDAAGTAYDLSMSSGATLNVVLDRATAGTSVTHNLSTATAGSGLGSGTVNISRGANVGGLATASFDTFNLGGGLGGTTSLAPAEGTQVSIGSVTKSNNAAAQTLGLAGSTTGNSISGAISNGAGTISVSKSGSSVWSLSGASTYTGTTTVTAGRLVVDGTIASSSLTTVAAGAILGGSGTLGATTVAGTHAPGNSPGVQTVAGNLTYSGGSNLVWELIANSTAGRGSDFDGITLTGASNLAFAGATTLDLDFALAGSAVNWSDTLWSQSVSGINGWKVFDLDTGAISGLENLAIGGSDWLDGGGSALSVIRPGAAFSLFEDGNDLYLNYTYVSAIPEPGSMLALGLLLGAPVVLRRRK